MKNPAAREAFGFSRQPMLRKGVASPRPRHISHELLPTRSQPKRARSLGGWLRMDSLPTAFLLPDNLTYERRASATPSPPNCARRWPRSGIETSRKWTFTTITMPPNPGYKRGDVVLVLFANSNLRTAKTHPASFVPADNLQTGLLRVISSESSELHLGIIVRSVLRFTFGFGPSAAGFRGSKSSFHLCSACAASIRS